MLARADYSWVPAYPTSQLTNQRQIILNLFGFSLIQTTLLGCVDGVIDSTWCPFDPGIWNRRRRR
jgi:hypothetical protein